MRRLSAFVAAGLLAGSAPVGASPRVDAMELHASPESTFQKESTNVIFRLKMASRPGAPLLLVQTDEQGQVLREIGILTDDGVMGDDQKNDLTYSRKIQINEKKARTLHFGVISADDRRPRHEIRLPLTTAIEVLDRPTLVELLARVWDQIKSGISQ